MLVVTQEVLCWVECFILLDPVAELKPCPHLGRQCSKARCRTRVSPRHGYKQPNGYVGVGVNIESRPEPVLKTATQRQRQNKNMLPAGVKLIGARLRWKLQIDGETLDPWLSIQGVLMHEIG